MISDSSLKRSMLDPLVVTKELFFSLLIEGQCVVFVQRCNVHSHDNTVYL